jgi:hypothetical protein
VTLPSPLRAPPLATATIFLLINALSPSPNGLLHYHHYCRSSAALKTVSSHPLCRILKYKYEIHVPLHLFDETHNFILRFEKFDFYRRLPGWFLTSASQPTNNNKHQTFLISKNFIVGLPSSLPQAAERGCGCRLQRKLKCSKRERY